MELNNFLNLLKRYKRALILIPLATVIVTYFLVHRLPNVYTSEAQIETGIVDDSQNLITEAMQGTAASQKFSNMIADIQMKKLLNQIAYKLMIHDLTSQFPFRPPSKDMRNLNPSARKHALEVYTLMHDNYGELSLDNPDQNGLDRVIGSMKYDAASISSKLVVFRSENSDFITVSFDSDNPELSAFVVNNLIGEFIKYYNLQTRQNQDRAVAFLDSLLTAKRAGMDSAISKLKDYKISHHILNLNEQAKSLYTQLADIETRKEQALKDIAAYTGSINNIDKQFDPNDKKYIESTLTEINSNILTNKQKLEQLTDNWIRSNYADSYKHSIDSLQGLVNRQINESIDKSTNTPLASKNTLITQKLNMQVQLDVAKFSIKSLSDEVDRLHKELDILVPNEASIQSLEDNGDVATREYLEVLQKYNQTTMQASFSTQLRQLELAVPEPPQSSKKMLLVILSGVVSVLVLLTFLFFTFYLDSSIKQPKALVKATGLPVLGSIYKLNAQKIDLNKLWETDGIAQTQSFKDQLRSIRFEIDQDIKDNKVLAITSLIDGEGKSMVALSLAHTYAVIGKKVLVIDGNFENRSISTSIPIKTTVEDFFKYSILTSDAAITVLGNKGGSHTLLELQDEKTITDRFKDLRYVYDLIIIEIPALEAMNKAKEWLLFADKTIAVYEAGQALTESKNVSVEYLKSLKDKFSGWVFNKMDPRDNI